MKKTITIDISKEFLEKGTLRFSAQTKKWNKEKIKNVLNEIYKLELKLKSNTSSKNILFKKLIVDICAAANA